MQGYKPEALRDKKKPKGGRIVGAGTGTSDSIKKEVQDGSYIMPADSTEAIGDQALQGMGGDVPVNVSNGEFEMPPEQVHAVGVQALDQMKNATHTPVPEQNQGQGFGYEPEMFFANGGAVDEEKMRRKPANIVFETTQPNPSAAGDIGQGALAMQGIADRATAGVNIPPSPLPGIGGYDPASPASPNPAPVAAPQAQPDKGRGILGNVADYAGGVAKTTAGILTGPAGYALDGARIGAANLFGGDADTLQGGRDKYRNASGNLLGSGIDDLKGVGAAIQAGGRDLMGIQAAKPQAVTAQPVAANPVAKQPAAAAVNPAQAPAVQPAATAPNQAAVDPAQPQVDPAQIAGMQNNITRVGNSFSAQGPIREGYTVNGQAQGQTNVAQAPQSAQNQQAVANLLERTPEFGAGTAAAGYQPNSAFAMPQQGGPRVTVVRDTSRDDRERAQLWNAASTAHKGAQNGQLTASQINTMRGMRNDERTDATSRRNTDANNAASLAREGINQSGANQREAGRRADQNSQFAATNSLAERQFQAGQAAQGYQTRAADRVEKAYERFDAAETPEERSAAAEMIRTLSGKDQAPRFGVAAGGQGFNKDGTPYTMPAQVYNQQTGEFVNPQQQQQQQPNNERPVGTKSTVNGKTAVWNGSQWIPQKG